MKKTILAAALLLATSGTAFAGTPMTVSNSALGFQLTQYPQGSVDMTLCDSSNTCLNFNQVKSIDSTTVLYKEASGKCELTVQTFEKSFANGNTKNEFMLDLMAFVVKVTVGEDNCKLQQSVPSQSRSLTGIYL